MMRNILLIVLLSLALPLAQAAQAEPAYGPELEGFDYPWPEVRFHFSSQRQAVQMAYLELKP